MKYILFLVFSGTTATGPTMPVIHSAEFDSIEACIAAAKELDPLTRRIRVSMSSMEYRCLPKGTPGTEKAG